MCSAMDGGDGVWCYGMVGWVSGAMGWWDECLVLWDGGMSV